MQYRAAVLLTLGSVVACGGGGETPSDVDAPAPIDAAIDAPIDGPPPCNGMVCGGECIDTTTSEAACGSCTNMCRAGEGCADSTCACAPPSFIIADPSILQPMILTNVLPMTSIAIGGYFGGGIQALIVAKPDAAQLNVAYPLSGDSPGVPPFLGAGYDVDIVTQDIAASFYATSGTITFTASCPGYLAGHADNVHFTPASGLMPPTLVDNDCAFDAPVPRITFAYGSTPCP